MIRELLTAPSAPRAASAADETGGVQVSDVCGSGCTVHDDLCHGLTCCGRIENAPAAVPCDSVFPDCKAVANRLEVTSHSVAGQQNPDADVKDLSSSC